MKHIEATRILPDDSSLILGKRTNINPEIERTIFPITVDVPWRSAHDNIEAKIPIVKSNEQIRVGVTSWKIRPARNLSSTYPSVGSVASTIEESLEKHFEVTYLGDIRNLKTSDKRKRLSEFLENIDVAFACINRDDSLIYQVRKSLGINVPIAWQPLGNVPQGAGSIRTISKFLRQGDTILVSCTADRETLKRLIIEMPAQVNVLPFSIDCQHFRPLSEKHNRMTRLCIGVPIDAPLLLYVGRINLQKNVHTIFSILEKVVEQEREPMLCIAGPLQSAPFFHFEIPTQEGYYDYLRDEIVKRSLAEHTVIVGNQYGKSLVGLYSAADILINCTISHDENFGYVQVESMACGTPVVCTDWGGLKDTVVHGETGFRMDTVISRHGVKVDFNQGVEAILRLIRDKALKQEQKEKSCLIARDRFSLSQMENNLIDIVKTMFHSRQEDMEDLEDGKIFFSSQALKMYEEWDNLYDKWGECPHVYPASMSFDSYQFLMAPYASRIANSSKMSVDQKPRHIVSFSIDGYMLKVNDPIWPCVYEIDEWEESIIQTIDGNKTIDQIAKGTGQNLEDVLALIRYLSVEGIVS